MVVSTQSPVWARSLHQHPTTKRQRRVVMRTFRRARFCHWRITCVLCSPPGMRLSKTATDETERSRLTSALRPQTAPSSPSSNRIRLALHAARRHHAGAHGRSVRSAFADRSRLSRAQARGRPRSLRRPRLALLPASRKSLRCSLWIPDLPELDDSPSGAIGNLYALVLELFGVFAGWLCLASGSPMCGSAVHLCHSANIWASFSVWLCWLRSGSWGTLRSVSSPNVSVYFSCCRAVHGIPLPEAASDPEISRHERVLLDAKCPSGNILNRWSHL
jgi:hypothetical protein